MYINLHSHTDYSNERLKDAISKVKDLINRNHELGNMGTCITEHESVSSAIQAQKYFFEKKKDAEWAKDKLLLGNEIYLCKNGLNADSEVKEFPHFILIALDEVGHQQLRVLSTMAWEHSFRYHGMVRVPTYYRDLFDVIGANPGHVVGSTACLGGSLPKQLLKMLEAESDDRKAEIYSDCIKWVGKLNGLFGDGKFFIELQPSRVSEEQRAVNPELLKLSGETGIPYIITTDAHYIRKEDFGIHKVFLESQEGERETEKFYSSTYCMGEAEIHEYLDDNIGPEAVQRGLDNTMLVYDMAEEYDLRRELHIPYLPVNKEEPDEELYQKYKDKVPLFEYYHDSEYPSDRHLLRELTEFMEKDSWSRTEKGYASIEECLESLKISSEKMNQRWSAYLLNMKDYVQICWDSGSLVCPGRGSGVGYRLNYMLGITQIDPIREKTPMYPWRFLNPERASVLDIDIDINPKKKDLIIENLTKQYKYVTRVATFGTEQSRSAIQSAARGLGYNDDYAQYVGSMVVADRGMTRTLAQMYYGDDDHPPDQQFAKEMNEHPDLWEAAQKIEGLIKSVGSHAGGVIISDAPLTDCCALMKTNSGDVVTQFDLHDCEDVGLIKIDLLATKFMTKLQVCLELLLKDHVVEWQGTLKDTYEKYLGVYTLERDNLDMWKMLWNHEIYSFFQMEKDAGIQAVALTKPTSVDDLAVINSVMRLMPQSDGDEIPLQKYARFKQNPQLWYDEMNRAGLTKAEQTLLEPILGGSYGICESQERLMMLPQLPELGGFSLAWVDKLRKSVAKKHPKDFAELEEEFFRRIEEQHLSLNLANYVWYTEIYTQRGYGFPASHALSYSLCGVQTLNLCWKYPIIYWNCANLIVDSDAFEDSTDNQGSQMSKISVAIADMQKAGIEVALPDINTAQYGFAPDVEHNQILYSLKAISGVGDSVARAILDHRPFQSLKDFEEKMVDTKLITPAKMMQLIKAGCFNTFLDPHSAMISYIRDYLFHPVSKLTMAHVNKLRTLLPKYNGDFYLAIPNFVKYVTTRCHVNEYITDNGTKRKLPKSGYFNRIIQLDKRAQAFFTAHYSQDSVVGVSGETYLIDEKKFLKESDRFKDELTTGLNRDSMIQEYNDAVFYDTYNSLLSQTDSEWEMNALGYYHGEHELARISTDMYGIVDFFSLVAKPTPYEWYSRYIEHERKWFPKYKIVRIAGTVVGNDNDKHTVTLLTPTGIVKVKFNKGQYVFYNQKISEIDEVKDKKTMLEDSWFKRGNKLIVCGYRQDFNFRAYRYSDTIYTHQVAKIEHINSDGTLEIVTERRQEAS